MHLCEQMRSHLIATQEGACAERCDDEDDDDDELMFVDDVGSSTWYWSK